MKMCAFSFKIKCLFEASSLASCIQAMRCLLSMSINNSKAMKSSHCPDTLSQTNRSGSSYKRIHQMWMRWKNYIKKNKEPIQHFGKKAKDRLWQNFVTEASGQKTLPNFWHLHQQMAKKICTPNNTKNTNFRRPMLQTQ